ncbi:hypothetical protein ABK040_002837 [Willaertia magna]
MTELVMVNGDVKSNNLTLDKINLDILNKIKFAKCGGSYFMVVTKLNEIYQFGTMHLRDIIHTEPINFTKLVEISKSNQFGNITHLECGLYITIIVNDLNEIYVIGRNQYLIGQNIFHKIFTKLNKTIPFEISDERIKFIRIKDFGFQYKSFCYVVTDRNNIYVIGKNMRGRLGLPNYEYNEFTKLDKFLNSEIKDLQLGNKMFAVLLDVLGNLLQKWNYLLKLKKILTVEYYLLLLNEFNELYLLKRIYFNEDNINEFTKININNITTFYFSYGDYFIIKNKYNEYFGIGDNNEGQLGFNYRHCDLIDDKYYIKEPKKLDYLMTNRKHITMLATEHRLFILSSDYKINCNEPINEEEKNINLQAKLFEKFTNGQLYDIVIC